MRPLLFRLLKVPPEPGLPPGSRESVQIFRAARNFYRLLLARWGLKQVSAVIGIVVSLTFLGHLGRNWSPQARFWMDALEWGGFGCFLVQVPFTFLMVRLDYELRWYIITDRSLRIRSGLLHVREITMTFANIQHLSVHQGPLQRLLGLYDLTVRTAGGGGMPGELAQHGAESAVTHIGHFHGVDNAPAIRDLILERMKRVRDAGLGDTDDAGSSSPCPGASPTGETAQFRAAIAELRTEARELRQALATRPD